MRPPLVSIITPTYNHEKYIGDCIKSVQAQTYSHWEMIIVDDGSSDNTFNIAKSFAATDNRIQVFTQQNIGIFRLGETYNFALSKSNGKYIAVLEGDDVWLPEKLDLQISGLEKDESVVLCWGMAYSSTFDLKQDYKLYPNNHPVHLKYYNNWPKGIAATKLVYTCFIPALTVVIRRNALEAVGGFIQNFNLPLVDLPTWQQLSLSGKFLYIDQPLGKWRIYSNQITKTYTAEMAEGFYKLAQNFYSENKEIFRSNNISKKNIDKYFKKLLVINYSRSGRYKLIRKEFAEARKYYLKSIFSFGWHEPLWKLRSITGLIFSIFRKDIESFTKILGRVSYK